MKKLLTFWLICCLALSLGSGGTAETVPGPDGLPEVRESLGAAVLIGTFAAEYFRMSAPEKLDGDPPITADEAELSANPRSRSAKLRIIEKLP